MKNEFDEEQDLLQPPERFQNRSLELSARQDEIYRNLQAIGPEIAAFFLDGIRILQNNDLETAANLLAHITREIDGGLRNILSEDKKAELEFVVSMPDGNNTTYEKGKEGSFKFESKAPGAFKVTYNRIGKHKASILQSLGINEPSPLAERWLEVTGEFHKFAHRHGAWEVPRGRETFVPLWNEFEGVLADLVGNYLNLLIKVVDRILAYKQPTKAIRKVLPNLLKLETRCKYFFENLDSSAWLEPLRKDGWFDPKSNISVRHSTVTTKSLDWFDWWRPLMNAGWFDPKSSLLTKTRERSSKTDMVSPWHALEYVERIAEQTKKHPCDETVNTLVEIIDSIVDCAENTKEKIIKDLDLGQRIIKIISALPEESRKNTHLTFIKSALENLEKSVNVSSFMRYAHRLIESIERNTNPALRELLSNNSRAERIKFLKQVRESIDEKNNLTEQGLANVYGEYVIVILQRFTNCLSVFQDILSLDQDSILSELLTALHNTEKIDWEVLLEFIYELLSLEHFWAEQEVNGFKYRDQILADAAELIAIGTNNDNYAFDPQLLPLVEKILLVLVEKAESSPTIKETPLDTFLSSSKGMVFWTMMEYALYFDRTRNTEQANFRWPQAIRADFAKRLNKNIESSFEFSLALGAFLPQLLYLDKKWVIDNIDLIFPQQYEHHWYVAFSMYLISSGEICKYLYSLLKEDGHYQKALNTNFAYHDVETKLATHICTFWLKNDEELDDETSLIYQVLNSDNLNFLSAVIHFFWDQRDNLSAEDRIKVRSAWRVLFKVVSQSKDSLILSALSRWVIFIDNIDGEALAWLKFSAKHTDFYFDIFVSALLTHVSKTPMEIGTIYIELSKSSRFALFTSLPAEDKVIETVRILYDGGHKDTANQICVQFAESGFDCLNALYNEYQH